MASANIRRTRKRVKTHESTSENDEPHQEDRSSWERHPDYYFDDGNLVILAENCLFRVHRTVLSLHSDVFRDLLAVLQPEEDEKMDGCPLLRIEDSVSLMELMFDTVYKGATSKFVNSCAGLTSIHLHLMLKVGNKYNIHHLRDEAIRRLKCMFPSVSLGQWNPLYQCREFANVVVYDDLRNELARVINMIRTHNQAAHVLPLVFYEYCQLPLAVVAVPNDSLYQALYRLSIEDTKKCLVAIPDLLKRKISVYNVFTDHKVSGRNNCKDTHKCHNVLNQLASNI
ncbi:hypothetical protein BC835DRAFT_1416469 [Cytidiella melzeri]|nr:hypothetical protein BC835DRAFT_1416469 [Cytidiella melzeri]